MTQKETWYLAHHQIVATEKAILEFAEDGFLFDTIKVFNNGKDHASWVEVEPTSMRDIFRLGVKTGFILQ